MSSLEINEAGESDFSEEFEMAVKENKEIESTDKKKTSRKKSKSAAAKKE